MLVDIPLSNRFDRPAPEPAAARLIGDAERRVEAFTRSRRPRIDNFVTSDFRQVDAALDWIVQQRLLCGNSFCEWGSGFGVVAMLAALRGLNSFGIEIEPSLVEEAAALAEDHGIEVEFATGSFITESGRAVMEAGGETQHVETETPAAYDTLGCQICDFDLIFAFPWPGEEEHWFELFDRFACDGALLLSYHGIEQLRLQRHQVTSSM